MHAHDRAADRTRIRAILHPTDFSEGSEVAFAHALKLALASRAHLEILHAALHEEPAAQRYCPRVRETLLAWGALPDADPGAPGVNVQTVLRIGEPPAAAILDELDTSGADLMVLATGAREGLDRLLNTGISEPVSRLGHVSTLFLPPGVEGFVRADDGKVTLARILVPSNHHPDPQVAVDVAAMIADVLDVSPLQLCTLFVGDEAAMPTVTLPTHPGWIVRRWYEGGEVVDAILDTAMAWQADLIVMGSRGHDSVLDTLRGSTVERVLRRAVCPVLVVPVT